MKYLTLFASVIAGFYGLTIGSFLNVLIYRLPRRLNFTSGRSQCPHCGHTLNALDLVPVLSYLLLKKRCRYCGRAISPRYMLIELATGIYFAGAVAVILSSKSTPANVYLKYGGFIAFLGAFCLLLVIFNILHDKRAIPLPLLITTSAIILVRAILLPGDYRQLLAGFIGGALLFHLFKNKIDYPADTKSQNWIYSSLLGLWAGLWPLAAAALVFSLIYLILRKKKRSRLSISSDTLLLSLPLFYLLTAIGALSALFIP